MRFATLALLLGACFIYCLPTRWSYWPFLLSLVITCAIAYRLRRRKASAYIRIFAFFLFGITWMLWHCQQVLDWQLPTTWQAKTLLAQGKVVSLPTRHHDYYSFIFQLNKLQNKRLNIRVKLNWYRPTQSLPDIKQGQYWQLSLRLKSPHSLANPGSFDYQRWTFAHRIRAIGYVVKQQSNRLLTEAHQFAWIAHLRQRTQQFFEQQLAGRPLAGMLLALSIGDKSHITQAQWQVLQNTGTNHLMAISGLHIGLTAGLAFLLWGFCWRFLPRLPLYLATPRAASLAALAMAFFYSAMAGFSISTQRACVMLVVFMSSVFLRRRLISWSGWSFALLVVLVLDPLAVLSASFWLSFSVVAGLIYGLSARLNSHGWWWKWGRTQWVSSLIAVPLTLLYFQNASFISPLANSLAIPLVGFITVPLTLLSVAIYLVSPWLAHYSLLFAYHSLEIVWWLLQHLSTVRLFTWQTALSIWQFVGLLLAVILLLAPRGWPTRYLSIALLSPLLFNYQQGVGHDQFRITLLDVGQGLATVVQTQHHTLVYDTGAKYSAGFDMGKAVIIPFLRHQGIKKIDSLIISHADNDHIGGANSLLSSLPVQQIMSSTTQHFRYHVDYCLQGKHWQWDGVNFTFLYPDKKHLRLGNNSSCVLRVSVGEHHLLLTGDIEKLAEQQLLQQQSQQLPADILVAPHHGSNTSSSINFIKAVMPTYVLFSVGYRNRFGLPKAIVLKRYQQVNAKIFDTATDGAISMIVSAKKIAAINRYRQQKKRIWW